MTERELLVCDLDNTLYDWVAYFVPAFYAMVDAVTHLTGCNKDQLLDDFREVHQKFHDTEHPFALLETRTIKELYPNESWEKLRARMDPAFHAFNSARKANLKLYPGVKDTLDFLQASGIAIVAHTESKLYGAVDRVKRLDLLKYFSRIYCRERSPGSHPFENKSGLFDEIQIDRVVELSQHQAKPNADVLLEICSKEGVPFHQAAYIGDSVARDVLMAKRANVFSIWARYGTIHDPNLYAGLIRISHWTAREVDREKKLQLEARAIQPDLIATHSFTEVRQAFNTTQEASAFN